jgi:signal peptidase I
MSDAAAPLPPELPADTPPLEKVFKGNRPLAAGVLLLLLEIVPAAGMVVALREEVGVWIVFCSVLVGGALIPPIGVFLGQRWGYALGQYVVWGSLVGVVLRVLHTGFSPIFLVPAVLLGVLLVALSAPKGAGETRRTERKPESFGVWFKENIEAIIIAFIMALVIRCFCIEVFKIPSSSMEPTLLGDLTKSHSRMVCTFSDYHVPLESQATSGDRIMVTKYFYAFSPVERFDVVVFKFPLNQAKNFIKRVVGLPDEELRIYHGNLYVRKPGEEKFRIARRTLRTQDSIWIDPAKKAGGYFGTFEEFKASWDVGTLPELKSRAEPLIQEGELSTQEMSGQRSIRFDYRPRSLDDGGSPVQQLGDMHIAFDFELTSPKGQVFAEVVSEHGRFEARLDTEGESQLRYHAPGSEKGQPTSIVPLPNVHLAMDRKYKFDLSIFDGVAYVRVNGVEKGRHPFIEFREEIRENEAPERRIAFGTRGATFKARNLVLGRDIYYRGSDLTYRLREDEVVKIPPQNYMMMGDNVANSHDSRAWVKRSYTLKDGRTIVCEAQQINESYTDFATHLKEKFDLQEKPDIGIDGDEHGNEVPIFRSDIVSEATPVPFRFVHEKFIVGKALWIWWPQGRWFHLIR